MQIKHNQSFITVSMTTSYPVSCISACKLFQQLYWINYKDEGYFNHKMFLKPRMETYNLLTGSRDTLPIQPKQWLGFVFIYESIFQNEGLEQAVKTKSKSWTQRNHTKIISQVTTFIIKILQLLWFLWQISRLTQTTSIRQNTDNKLFNLWVLAERGPYRTCIIKIKHNPYLVC